MTVESIGQPPMSWDQVGEVFDFKRPFQTRGEEAAERSDEASKEGDDSAVDQKF